MTIDVPPQQRWGFRGRGGQSEERGWQQPGSGTDQGSDEQQAAVLRDTVKPRADEKSSHRSTLVPDIATWVAKDLTRMRLFASPLFIFGRGPVRGRVHTRPRVDTTIFTNYEGARSPENSPPLGESVHSRGTLSYITHRFVSPVRHAREHS